MVPSVDFFRERLWRFRVENNLGCVDSAIIIEAPGAYMNGISPGFFQDSAESLAFLRSYPILDSIFSAIDSGEDRDKSIPRAL